MQKELAMNRCEKFMLGLLLAAVVTPCLAREPVTLAQVKDKSEADSATPEGKAYLKQFFTNPWMLAMDAADGQCKAALLRSGLPEEWVFALSIGDNGYPSDVLVSPSDNEGLRCMADRLKATGFIKPPHEGFAIYMAFRQTEPGTEHRDAAPESGTTTKGDR
jgi:hypothetical protein